MPEAVVIKKTEELRERIREAARNSKSIGFVPTMGALHAGHRSLIERARRENDVVIVSLYVNPTQFGPGEDFERYPRTFDADVKICSAVGADYIFAPENLYTDDARTWVQVGQLDETLEGLSRPGHFRGVATVVTKLLSIVRPDRAYFGRKDAQQLVIIQALVRDLDLGCEVVPCETVREADGLAMSSRNRYLSPAERKQALAIPHALQWCREKVAQGERSVVKLMEGMAEILTKQPDIEIDYISFVNAETLVDLKRLRGNVLAAIAAKVGNTRLIDNAQFENVS